MAPPIPRYLFYIVEMRIMTRIAWILILAASWAVAQNPPEGDTAVLVLKGLDPVLLVKGQEKPGREDLFSDHEGFRYRFASARNQKAFLTDPQRFAVQLGGACPVRPDLRGKPEIFLVHQGRIYLFFTEHCRQQFEEDPQEYLDKLPKQKKQ